MDVLEREREATETRFRSLLEELARHTEAVRDATARCSDLYGARVQACRQAPAADEQRTGATRDEASPQAATAWPLSRRGVRGTINRLARWLLRDYLETLDRRGDLLDQRFGRLHERVNAVQEMNAGETAEALVEALAGTQAALAAALATHREMLNLVNAKDAELLQRAVAGPLRRMELLFDEFGRQQEALLSQLVGRRRELDEIVRALSPAPEEGT